MSSCSIRNNVNNIRSQIIYIYITLSNTQRLIYYKIQPSQINEYNFLKHIYAFAQSAGAAEHTDCTSAEGYPLNECPG